MAGAEGQRGGTNWVPTQISSSGEHMSGSVFAFPLGFAIWKVQCTQYEQAGTILDPM